MFSNTGASTRSFIDLEHLSAHTLHLLMKQATFLKRNPKKRYFDDVCLVMIFEKQSTRTRVSFEVGIHQLGGYSVVLEKGRSQISRGETMADTARVLSRYADLLMFRGSAHEDLLALDRYSSVPVINGLTDFSHPCQVLTDIFTYCELRGSIEGKVVTWVGDGRNNMVNSWMQASALMGFELRVASPKAFAPYDSRVMYFSDPVLAVTGADMVTTDSWVSMGDVDIELRHKEFPPYQVDLQLFNAAKADALFMHCLPAHRGNEVTNEVMDHDRSCVFDEAENRLHVQKAIMLWCLDLI